MTVTVKFWDRRGGWNERHVSDEREAIDILTRGRFNAKEATVSDAAGNLIGERFQDADQALAAGLRARSWLWWYDAAALRAALGK